jgi:pimeloyl-ACP methyl ester carboxylesterase
MATFVICHGAWGSGALWRKMRPLLRSAGHEIFTPTYSGLGDRAEHAAPHVDLDTHIRDIGALLYEEDLTGVVLVGHSYGGMVATGVADRLRERLARLIYLDAFVPRSGQSLFDLLPLEERSKREAARDNVGGGWLLPPGQIPADTSEADVKWMTPRRHWQPIKTFTQPIILKGSSTSLPRCYIYCTRTSPDDRFAPFAKRAKEEGGWRYLEIDASHSPHITAPERLANLFELALRNE